MKVKLDEVKLWNEFREGNYQSFSKLYQHLMQPLFTYSLGITNDKELIRDSIHDLFVELWKNHENIGPTTNVRFYLMASIKRKLIRCMNYQLKSGFHHYNYLLDEDDSFKSKESTMIEAEVEDLQGNVINICMEGLSKRQREAISLKYFKNMDTDQISSIMKINHQSVYNLIFGALKIMKSRILDFDSRLAIG